MEDELFEIEVLQDAEFGIDTEAVCTCGGGCCNNSNNTADE